MKQTLKEFFCVEDIVKANTILEDKSTHEEFNFLDNNGYYVYYSKNGTAYIQSRSFSLNTFLNTNNLRIKNSNGMNRYISVHTEFHYGEDTYKLILVGGSYTLLNMNTLNAISRTINTREFNYAEFARLWNNSSTIDNVYVTVNN